MNLNDITKSMRDRLLKLKSLIRENKNLRKYGVAITLTLVLIVSSKYLFHISFTHLPTLEEQAAGIVILDKDDKKVCVVQREGERKPVALAQISKNMQQACIAVEDRNFYTHLGVDPIGIARATYMNVKEKSLVEGGSTITQQLMKNLFFEYNDKSLRRKFLELVMAVDVEAGYSKERILETYLNQVYFGRGAYGVEQAARTYFNKSASKLTIPESAFLAGLIKAPSTFGNPENRELSLKRQHQVLKDMKECRFITEKEADSAKATNLEFDKKTSNLTHPFYVDHVIGILKEELGENRIWSSPLVVYTNMDTQAQSAAEKYLMDGVKRAPKGLNQGALVSISVDDGSVVAMVGSADSFRKSQWNRALNPHTAGSTFKPFVYLAALIEGKIGPSTVLYDEPFTIPATGDSKAYTPKNYDNKFLGAITVRDALRLSRNVCAVKVAMDTGLEKIISTAGRAGINSKMEPYPSLALGACAASPIELANAYATIAREGEFIEPRFIRSVHSQENKLVKHFKSERRQKLDKESCNQLVDAMQDVVRSGTGHRASLSGIAVAGKTGTADDHKDIWFVGMTPGLVTAVWAGNDDNKAIRSGSVTGGNITARIWKNYMSSYYRSHEKPKIAFAKPEHPLRTDLPFYTIYQQAISETIDDFTESFNSASGAIKELPKAGDSIIKRVSKHLKKMF